MGSVPPIATGQAAGCAGCFDLGCRTRESSPMDFLSVWHLWVIAGLIAVALEIKLSGFVMLWFALGAFASAVAAALGFGPAVQTLMFTLVSLCLFAASRTVFEKLFMRNVPSLKIGLEAMVGAEATVVEALPAQGGGTVRINGELWAARSVDGAVASGELVEVASVEGLKLKVRRAQQVPMHLVPSSKEKQ